MAKDERRVTLVARHPQLASRSWQISAESASRIVLLDSFTMLRATLFSPLVKDDLDVERIIFDRSCSEADYLSFLAELRHEFHGDVVMIREDNTGFLSATGRGGDRILYALSADDMEFYLETQHLVSETEQLWKGVLHFRPRVVAVAHEAAPSEEDLKQASKKRADDSAKRSDGRRR
jgi:hypothetical protein